MDVSTAEVVTISVSVSDVETTAQGNTAITVQDALTAGVLLSDVFQTGDLSGWRIVDEG